ncbi:hypothetical protein VCHA48O428_300039 [Vibrio chagasii]|nr:hypothetical protein VCHA48O428_300039 [Vibrio chagasii]
MIMQLKQIEQQRLQSLLNQRMGRSIGWAGDVVCVCGQKRDSLGAGYPITS